MFNNGVVITLMMIMKKKKENLFNFSRLKMISKCKSSTKPNGLETERKCIELHATNDETSIASVYFCCAVQLQFDSDGKKAF